MPVIQCFNKYILSFYILIIIVLYFLKCIYFMCMCGLLTCICISQGVASAHRSEDSLRSPSTVVLDGCVNYHEGTGSWTQVTCKNKWVMSSCLPFRNKVHRAWETNTHVCGHWKPYFFVFYWRLLMCRTYYCIFIQTSILISSFAALAVRAL